MMKRITGVLAITFAGAALTACATGPGGDGPQSVTMNQLPNSPSSAEVLDNARCGATEYLNLIGQNVSAIPPAVRARARVLADNQPATQDFSATRLNIIYTASNSLITTVRCG